MRATEAQCYVTFPTTYFALRAESRLKGSACPFRLVPVPRSISSSCGAALQCDCRDWATIAAMLAEGRVEVEGVYRVEGKLVSALEAVQREEESTRGT